MVFTMLSCEKLRKLSCSECHVMRGTGKSIHPNFYETLLDVVHRRILQVYVRLGRRAWPLAHSPPRPSLPDSLLQGSRYPQGGYIR